VRPVSKGARPNAYAPPPSFDFSGVSAANQAKVNRELGTLTPTVQDCVELGRKIAAVIAPNPPHGYAGWKEAYDDVIRPKLEDEYKLAAVPLSDQLGTYCSYCETYCPGLIEVEHTLCKTHFPTYTLDWDNFLLACGPCNTKKGNKPTRKEVRAWLGHDIQQESECHDEIRVNRHRWPDLDNGTYRALRPALWADPADNGGWSLVTATDACDLSNHITWTWTASHTVRADVANVGNDIPVEVRLDDTDPKAAETIALLGLNTHGSPNTVYDRRVMNRTRAWFEVLQAVQPLLSNPPLSQAAFSAVWRNAVSTAKYGGFYSVWVAVLENFTDPQVPGQRLADRFVQDAAADYLNTDTALVP